MNVTIQLIYGIYILRCSKIDVLELRLRTLSQNVG